VNEQRARTRDRTFQIGLNPSLLAKMSGWYPSMVTEFFTGQRELPVEYLARLENTLQACERVAELSPTPVRWQRLDLVQPLVAKYRKEIEDRRIHEASFENGAATCG
jgi:hypothetical protein